MAVKKESANARSRRNMPKAEESQTSMSSDQDGPLSARPHPELVFGLVGPIGVNLEPVISALSRELNALQYKPLTIQLSRQIESFFGTDYSSEVEDDRILKLMDEGTRLRNQSGRGDAMPAT